MPDKWWDNPMMPDKQMSMPGSAPQGSMPNAEQMLYNLVRESSTPKNMTIDAGLMATGMPLIGRAAGAIAKRVSPYLKKLIGVKSTPINPRPIPSERVIGDIKNYREMFESKPLPKRRLDDIPYSSPEWSKQSKYHEMYKNVEGLDDKALSEYYKNRFGY